MSEFFYRLPIESRVASDIYLRASNAPESEWVDYYNFRALKATPEWEYDSWWSELYKAHPFIAGVIKLDENTYYDWHMDTDRGVGINLLLNNWDTSHCMFSPKLKRGDSVEKGNVKSPFVELKYEPNTYYLFNSQKAHTVYNFKGTRYLLSVDFLEDRTKLTYNQLLDEVKQEKWIG
jgi:hypothetical protein